MLFLTKQIAIPSKQTNTQIQFSSVQLLSHVWLFAAPWTAAHQASLSFTNSRGLPKLIFIKLVVPSNHLILCRPLLLLPSNKLKLYYIFILCLLVMKSALQMLKVVSTGAQYIK